jgi:hypothetical protein
MGEIRNAYKVLVEKPEGKRDNSDDLSVDGKILERALGEEGEVLSGCIWLRIGPVAGLCKHNTESSSSIKGGEFD